MEYILTVDGNTLTVTGKSIVNQQTRDTFLMEYKKVDNNYTPIEENNIVLIIGVTIGVLIATIIVLIILQKKKKINIPFLRKIV